MGRSRPASDPISFHRPTVQYYVIREGKRVYLGADGEITLEEYHRPALRAPRLEPVGRTVPISMKEPANGFLGAHQANWRNPKATLRCYREWLGRFLSDHAGLEAGAFTTEAFARGS